MGNGEQASLQGTYLKNRAFGYAIALTGLVFYGVGILLLPDLSDPAIREDYQSFFTASGALSAGIFVTLAVASRQATSNLTLGIATVFFVGSAALAAVILLLPTACTAVYSVAFVILVGGGIAGLISTAAIAAAALLAARTETEEKILESLQRLVPPKPPAKQQAKGKTPKPGNPS